MKNLLLNWKTTSAGLTMMIGAIVHLIFAVKAGTADENTWTTSLLAIAGGVGLLAAGDSAKSATKDDVANMGQAAADAIKTGNTEILTKTDIPTTTPKTP